MVQVDARARGVNYGWFIVAALFTIWSVVFGIQFSFGIFFRSLQDALGCSRGAISWAMTIYLLVFALVLIPTGWALERFNIRSVYSLAAFGLGIALVLCSRVSESWQLYLFHGLLGACSGIYGPSIFTVIIRWFSKKRGLALGITSAGIGFGQIVVPPLTNALIASYGWRNTFVILGLSSFIILYVCAQFIRKPKEPTSDETEWMDGKSAQGEQTHPQDPLKEITFEQAIRTREMMFILAGSIAAQMTSRMIMVHIAPHAVDIGISPFVAAMALSTIGCGSLLGRIVMGFIQDRIGAQRSMIICMITMSVCLFVLPFITSDVIFFLFIILFGLAYGGDVPQVPALAVQCFGVASMSVVYAFIAASFNILGSLGPLAAGYIFDATQSYTIVFLGAAVFLVLGAFSISRIKFHP